MLRTIKKIFTPDMKYQFNNVSALTLTMTGFSFYTISYIYNDVKKQEMKRAH